MTLGKLLSLCEPQCIQLSNGDSSISLIALRSESVQSKPNINICHFYHMHFSLNLES